MVTIIVRLIFLYSSRAFQIISGHLHLVLAMHSYIGGYQSATHRFRSTGQQEYVSINS